MTTSNTPHSICPHFRQHTRTLVTAIAGAAITASAPAQTPTDNNNELLRGPAVTDTHVPGAADSFAGRPMAGANARPDERPIPFQLFLRAVRDLNAPGVDPALRLNDGQRAVIEVTLRLRKEAVADWRTEHQDELRRLRNQLRPGDQPRGRRGASIPPQGDQPPRPGQPMDRRADRNRHAQRLDGRARDGAATRPPIDEQSRAELKALMATRPSPEPQQAQIWEILTPRQQAFVEHELDRIRDEAVARRQAHQMRREQRQARRQRPGDQRPADQPRRGKRRNSKAPG